ncbi:MAG: hypothetical protein Hals2KO_19400 [Halioglobus sp.]
MSIYTQGVYTASLVTALIVLLLFAVTLLWLQFSRQKSSSPPEEVVDLVESRPDWGPNQQRVWDSACVRIDQLLVEQDDVAVLPDHSMEILRHVSSSWNEGHKHIEYAATLPEVLLAIETLASRYRSVVLENVPLSNEIKISRVLDLWERYRVITDFADAHQGKIQIAKRLLKVFRWTTPQGIFTELRSILLDKLGEQAYENLIYNLKRAYLQEVASVAIDLYSGNFKRTIGELPVAADTQRDLDRLAKEIGPIRIVVLGQVSAGKSALINVLLGEMKAESGLLPTTESDNVYKFTPQEGLETHLVDTPGMEPDQKSLSATIERLSSADLVIWVMRANQPARDIDRKVYTEFEQFFENCPDRQRPAILVAATHIDRVPAFSEATESEIAEVTLPLAKVCAEVVEYDFFCPLALQEPLMGVNSLKAAFFKLYDRAVNTRLNRIRLSKPSLYQSASHELSHIQSGTLNAFKLAIRKRASN